MRIALLAMTEPAGAGQPFPRAFLRIAGASLARHQLGLALALDCHRIICIARSTSPELIELQHAAEDAGLQFHVISGARQLTGLVTAADELVVVSEGLFVDPAEVVPLVAERGALVLVQPIEAAQGAGFERIDLNRAAAGIARMPGEMVERLQDLPADCDLPSALTRIALQGGAHMREVPATVRVGGSWAMVRSETEALGVEAEWLRQHFGQGLAHTPGRALAQYGAISFGSSLLHAGNASNALSVAVVTLLLFAAGLGWFGLAWAGFLCTGFAWILVETSRKLRAAERQAQGQVRPAIPRADLLGWTCDVVMAGLMIAGSVRYPGEPLLAWLAPPVLLVLLLGLVARVVGRELGEWIGDRALLGLVLAVAVAIGQLVVAIPVLSLLLLAAALILQVRPRD